VSLCHGIIVDVTTSNAIHTIHFPEDLPVSARRADIMSAIQAHQVVIVCGETGSGKTTQLPKMALALGRGGWAVEELGSEPEFCCAKSGSDPDCANFQPPLPSAKAIFGS